MSNFVISCCSTADLSQDFYEERDIKYSCFHYQVDGVEYLDDMYSTMSEKSFYEAMLAGSETKTSQINADEFEAYFRPFLEKGLDILHITLSSGISGVGNSALIAKNNLEDDFPDRKIMILDSLGASSGYGLLVSEMAKMRDEGATIEEVYAWGEEHRLNAHHWFCSTDLTFYIRGGRVTKTEGFVGNLLNICPILNIDYVGKLIPRGKVRTKKKVLAALVEQMKLHADDGLEYGKECFISASYCDEDAAIVKELVEASFPNLKGKVKTFKIGTTIGSHTGPGTVALFFWGDKRED